MWGLGAAWRKRWQAAGEEPAKCGIANPAEQKGSGAALEQEAVCRQPRTAIQDCC